MKSLSIVFAAAVTLASCTTSYQSSGLSGGFSQTQLSDVAYQVRFQGNGYTSAERVSQFLLRRAAELTLEQGHRYFVIGSITDQTRSDGMAAYPAQSVTVRFLTSSAEDPNASDAVLVMSSTEALAGGRMSPAASAALRRMQ